MRYWLLFVLVAFSSLQTHAQAMPYPPLCGDSSGTGGGNVVGVKYSQNWSAVGFWGATAALSGIVIDFNQTSCVAQPINITVSNHQVVTIAVQNTVDCKGDFATQAITPVQAPDSLGALFKFIANAPTAFGALVRPSVTPSSGPVFITLPNLANAKDVVTLSCNGSDGKPTKTVKTVNVTFQNPALLTGSAGVLVSTLGKKQYGVNTTVIGVSNGTVASQYTIGVTSSSTVQLVPIAFINLYGYGNRINHLDIQAGLGINPNGSKTRVEYLLGPAFSTHSVYFGAGVHIAQAEYLQSGYQVGQNVASQGFSVPTNWRTTLKLGFSLTYSPSIGSGGSK